jgi:peptidoglycan/xylan/chitin deacetylase (PgdA/CDA1 family)
LSEVGISGLVKLNVPITGEPGVIDEANIVRTGESVFRRHTLKGRVKSLLTRIPVVREVATIATRKQPRIFVYHRFSKESHSEPTVIDAATFDWQVRHIQRNFRVITLGEYVRSVREKTEITRPTAIITVDDGYRDFYEIAYPILRKHELRATFFVTFNFIEKKIWLWPDILSFALENTEVKNTFFQYEGASFHLDTDTPASIRRGWAMLSDFCIGLEDVEKWDLISRLLAHLGVVLPKEPITEYAPVTWEQIKEMNDQGIEIGSHTLNHPILSKVRDERLLREEIEGSRKAIEERIGERVTTFCYPNSMPGDINEKVVRLVMEGGYEGAVFGIGAFFEDLYRLPRIGVSSDKTDFLWKTCGLENLSGQFHFS